MMMKLSTVKQGNKGRIVKIEGSREFKKKLLVMGLMEGEELSVENVSPLGSPIVVNIKSSKVALRKEEAEKIVVDIS